MLSWAGGDSNFNSVFEGMLIDVCYSAFVGMVVMVALLPLPSYIASFIHGLQVKKMATVRRFHSCMEIKANDAPRRMRAYRLSLKVSVRCITSFFDTQSHSKCSAWRGPDDQALWMGALHGK